MTMAAAMNGLRGVWLTVGAASPKRVPAGARALTGGPRSARAAGAVFPRLPRERYFVPSETEQLGSMSQVFQERGGVVESNVTFITAAETEEAHDAQSELDAPREPRELFFVPSETPLIFESLARSPSTIDDKTPAGAKTVEVNGMRFFLVEDPAPAAGEHL